MIMGSKIESYLPRVWLDNQVFIITYVPVFAIAFLVCDLVTAFVIKPARLPANEERDRLFIYSEIISIQVL